MFGSTDDSRAIFETHTLSRCRRVFCALRFSAFVASFVYSELCLFDTSDAVGLVTGKVCSVQRTCFIYAKGFLSPSVL